jgi:uncharacterized membrane protein YhaH (DUF805 family)
MRPALGLSAYMRVADFRGRSTRTEVVCFFLAALLFEVIAKAFAALTGFEPDFLHPYDTRAGHAIAMLAIEHLPLIPIFALTVRRLHDIGLPGWPGPLNAALGLTLGAMHLLSFRTPGIAGLPLGWEVVRVASLLLFYVGLFWAPSGGPNRFGADPRGIETV